MSKLKRRNLKKYFNTLKLMDYVHKPFSKFLVNVRNVVKGFQPS